MATNPDRIFAKLLLAQPLTVNQKAEVTSWQDSGESEKLVAWVFANLDDPSRRRRAIKIITHLLGNDDVKTRLAILVILIHAPLSVLKHAALQEAICSCFSDSVLRQNSTQVLARLSGIGYAKARELLIKAKNDPDSSVRKNAHVLLRE
jgi:hypothetical protein